MDRYHNNLFMNSLVENLLLNLFLPIILIIFLLIIKRFLNRYLPFSRVNILYYFFSLSSGFFLFLLLTNLSLNQYIKQSGYAIFTFLLVLLISRCLHIWFKETYLPKHRKIQIPFLLIDIVRWIILITFVFIILKVYFKINLTGIFATSAVATAVIGFALQDILKNFFSGITLNMEIPFRKGDWIEVSNQVGEVIEMSWRATKIKTIEGNFIIIPNANVSQENIINYSTKQRNLARYVKVGVHYRHPPKIVKDIIKKAALLTEGVLKTPEPITRLTKFNDYSINYQCKFWIDNYPNLYNIEDAVKSKIWYFFKQNGIEIPFPIRTVYTYKGEETKEKDTSDILDILQNISLFSPLTKNEIKKLSENFSLGYFSRGERLIEEGKEGKTFFIIKKGHVSVNIKKGQQLKSIKYLTDGDFFGEMSLLTGEKRTATIIAEENTEVLILDREYFAQILNKKPKIADKISKILVERKEELSKKTEKDRPPKIKKIKAEEKSILNKIKKVFGLKKR